MLAFFRFLLSMLVLSAVALVSAIVTMHFAIHGTEVAVPNLSGLTLPNASQQARAASLNLAVENRFYSADVPAGHILSQSPAPGSIVRHEWHVRVTESLGPQHVAIPNVEGQPERIATITLRRLGLELGTLATIPWPSAPPGTVIAQNPPPAAAGIDRPRVSLLIAASTNPSENPTSVPVPGVPAAAANTGPEFIMPDLTGQPFPAAALAVSRAGFHLAPTGEADLSQTVILSTATGLPITAAPRPPVPSGTVVSQAPTAGSVIPSGGEIRLIVAH